MRDDIGVTDICRRSLTSLTGVHLGTVVITEVRQADGTTPEATDILIPFLFFILYFLFDEIVSISYLPQIKNKE